MTLRAPASGADDGVSLAQASHSNAKIRRELESSVFVMRDRNLDLVGLVVIHDHNHRSRRRTGRPSLARRRRLSHYPRAGVIPGFKNS